MRSIFRSLELMDSTLDDLHSNRRMVILPPSISAAFTLELSFGDTHDVVDWLNNTINTPLYHQLFFDSIKTENTRISFLQSYLPLLSPLEYNETASILQKIDGKGTYMKSWKSFIQLLTRGFHLLPSH